MSIVAEWGAKRTNLVSRLKHLEAALSVLGKLNGGTPVTKPRHTLSAAARKKISLAQKARWAKQASSSGQVVAMKPKRTMSLAARKKIGHFSGEMGEDKGSTEESRLVSPYLHVRRKTEHAKGCRRLLRDVSYREIPARKTLWTPFIVTLTIAIPRPEETASSVNPSTLHSVSVLPWTNWCMANSTTTQRHT